MIRVDLRSDTVTHPSPEMRQAMYDAELGDDVYGDDPTVNRLQERAAEMLGKEAGLFGSSGTPGNLVCVLTPAQRGAEVPVREQRQPARPKRATAGEWALLRRIDEPAPALFGDERLPGRRGALQHRCQGQVRREIEALADKLAEVAL